MTDTEGGGGRIRRTRARREREPQADAPAPGAAPPTAPASASASSTGSSLTGGGTAIRGAILIGAAVLLGVVLLGKGLDSGFVNTGSDGGSAGNGTEDDGGTTPTGATTPDGSAVTRAPAEVTVWVLNGGGPTGTATNGTQVVANAGYATVGAANAPQDVPQSIIYYVEGYQPDAAAIAGLLGFPADRVVALPEPPPVPNGDIQGANVVAVLGPDFQPTG